jgi:hypothetical protein
MSEKIRTIYIGDFVCVTTTDFPDTFPDGVTYVSEYPRFNPLKRSKSNLPFMGFIPDNVMYVDLPEIDVKGNATKEKWRLMFMDNFANKSINLAKNIPAIVSLKRKFDGERAINDEMSIKFIEMLERFGYKTKDERTRTLIDELNISKEAKRRLFSPTDYQQGGFER